MLGRGEIAERWPQVRTPSSDAVTNSVSVNATEAALGMRVIRGVAPWQQQSRSRDSHMTGATTSAIDAGPAILGIHYWCEGPHTKHGDLQSCSTSAQGDGVHPREPSRLLESLTEPPSLLLVTHMGLLRLNANTLELRDALQFRGESRPPPDRPFQPKPPLSQSLWCPLLGAGRYAPSRLWLSVTLPTIPSTERSVPGCVSPSPSPPPCHPHSSTVLSAPCLMAPYRCWL